ncbi:hypothetical protein [Photobacterium leiognathi]|uniref:hypothetical protein n=1 Tax=Photobacterium leiognathi TaxID=553611 RepID=UPI002980CCAB|nr:hypothetical protein [Photobacterium leiognathi]
MKSHYKYDDITDNITDAHTQLGLPCEDKAHLETVIILIEKNQHTSRQITHDELRSIKIEIKTIPTGKQRVLRRALNNTLYYLHQHCGWQIPQPQIKKLIDTQLIWMQLISQQANDASRLYATYLEEKRHFLKYRPEFNIGFITVALSIEVAPLSLDYWADILNRPEAIELYEQQLTLIVHHQSRRVSNEPSSHYFTRYALTPFTCRLLLDYFETRKQKVTTKGLHKALNHYLSTVPYGLANKTAMQWQHCFQNIWFFEYGLPSVLLLDISQPHRHVAFHPCKFHVRNDDSISNIYDHDWHQPDYSTFSSNKSQGWPHRDLLKAVKNQPSSKWKAILNAQFTKPPAWDYDNIIPTILYHFTYDLIQFGGVKADILSPSTIHKYTNIYTLLTDHPLSYSAACDHDALMQWATTVYDKLESEGEHWLIYNFFRFLPQLSVTEHFDITQFSSPFLSLSVDPFRLSTDQCFITLNALLSQSNGSALQRLFCAVALILGFYGALRRGEVLRLRCQDIVCNPDDLERITLCIRNTDEGNTKSKDTRFIYLSIPEPAAKLVYTVSRIKRHCLPDDPLLGFVNETMASRQLHYLLPITKALKILWGNNVRFHHLRHSGAHWLMQQGLQFTLDWNISPFSFGATTQAMLTRESCQKRFDFWLEGLNFSDVNDGLLFDVIGKQLGHRHYTTTRWSYLHGVEWLTPLFSTKDYTTEYDELRYLLKISPQCKSVFRFLKSLYSERKEEISILNEQEVIRYLLKKKRLKELQSVSPKQDSFTLSDDNNAFKTLWLSQCPETTIQHHRSPSKTLFNYQTLSLVESLISDNEPEPTFLTLSQLWEVSGKHNSITLTKTQRLALSKLGPMIIDNKNLTLTLTLKCNKVNGLHFEQVFRLPLFRCFHFHFDLQQNRKTDISNNLQLINTHFKTSKDTLTTRTVDKGKTKFTITLTFIPQSPCLFQMLCDFLHYG